MKFHPLWRPHCPGNAHVVQQPEGRVPQTRQGTGGDHRIETCQRFITVEIIELWWMHLYLYYEMDLVYDLGNWLDLWLDLSTAILY